MLLEERDLNFSAYVAATQVHVSGPGRWRHPEIVAHAYMTEPQLVSLTAAAPARPRQSVSALLHHRWRGYRNVLDGFPLVGFPRCDGWSLETWFDALGKSPISGGPDDAWRDRRSKPQECRKSTSRAGCTPSATSR